MHNCYIALATKSGIIKQKYGENRLGTYNYLASKIMLKVFHTYGEKDNWHFL